MRGAFATMRSRLFLLVGMAILPALGLLLWSGTANLAEAKRTAERNLQITAELAVAEHALLVEMTRQYLLALAQLPAVREGRPNECSALFADMLREQEMYTNVGVVGLEGVPWCSAVPVTGVTTFADRAWFQEALRTEDFVFGGYALGRIVEVPLAAYGHPVLDDSGDVNGVVFAGMDLSWVHELLEKPPLPDGAVLTVVDGAGYVLARSEDPDDWVGRLCPVAEMLDLDPRNAEPEILETENPDGIRSLYVAAPFASGPEGQAHVYVELPAAVAYAVANRTLLRNIIVLGLIAASCLGVAWWFGDLLIRRPVRKLQGAASRLGAGDLSVRSGLFHGRSELGQLAHAIDKAAEALEEQDLARRATEERLAHLVEKSPVVLYSLDPANMSLTWVSPNVREFSGFEPDEVLHPEWWYEHLHPDDKEHTLTQLSEIVEEGHGVLEYRLARKDGTWSWTRDELRVVGDEGGSPREIIGSWVEVSERKEAEQRVAAQLATLRALYDGARRLTATHEESAVAKEVCRTCVEVFGLSLAWVGTVERDGRMRVLAQSPTEHPHPQEFRERRDQIPQSQHTTNRAVRNRVPHVANDILSDPISEAWRQEAEKHGIRSTASFPLASRERVLTTLNLYSGTPGFFTSERLQMFQALANQAAGALQNARLLAETRRRSSHLQVLRNIDLAITGSLDPRITLRVLLEEVTHQLEVDAAAVFLLNPHSMTLQGAGASGFRDDKAVEGLDVALSTGFAGQAAAERRVVEVADVDEAEIRPGLGRDRLLTEGFVSLYAAPMIAKGRVLGVLETFHRTPREGDSEWLGLLEALAGQAAIAVDNARLFADLEQSSMELRLAYDTTIEAIARTLECRDIETKGHSRRGAELTLELARRLGMQEDELVHARRGVLLHDIGKLGVPDRILFKPGKLTEEEWAVMRQHPEYAYEMLSPIAYLRPALDIPYSHHERWDGKGYPRGLRGEDIPLAARIFAVVDAWDAMRSDRPYRKALSVEEALGEIEKGAGTQFDPRVVEAFLEVVGTEGDNGA
ncbi:MAG: GAF domain-containing protein [Candidatus Bipolaricaulota bacterium]